MNKRLAIILAGFAIALIIGGITAYVLASHAPATASGEPQHHGMSPAIWVAIFTAVYVPLIAGAARRRRDRKDRGDKS